MRRWLAVAAAAVVATLGFLLLPFGAGASGHGRLVIATNGTIALGDHPSGSGTFIGDGVVSDHGSFAVPFAVAGGENGCVEITAEYTFRGEHWTLVVHANGPSCSFAPNDPRSVSDFTATVSGGTGAYAGLSGSGKVTGVADFTSSTFTTVLDLSVENGR